MTPATLRLAEGYVAVKPLGPVPVKGLAEPVEVYEVTGAGPARTRLQAAAARGLTRFVGRDAELEQLRRALERAGEGHGQVVAVVGEPGVGKSRLVYEFTHSHRLHGWLVLESGSVSYGKATSYLPVIDLLKELLQDRGPGRPPRDPREGDGQAPDARRVPSSRRCPALLALLDVPVEDAAWAGARPAPAPPAHARRVKRLLLRESQVQPLLLVFEDLHWIDAETQALLDSLVDSLPAGRLLLLVNYRPEYQHGWGEQDLLQPAPARPAAAPRAPSELLRCAPGRRARAWSPLKQLLIERTEGNPFFLEESVRTLVETEGAGGRARARIGWPQPVERDPGPGHGAGDPGRADRPAPAGGQAAAPGRPRSSARTCRSRCSRRSPSCAEEALRRGLAHLQAAEFLYETRLFPDLEYTFKHALTHEVAYGSLLQERRRALHARIVEAIERLHPDRLERARRAARPSRPSGRAVGQGGRSTAARRAQGGGALGAPRGA